MTRHSRVCLHDLCLLITCSAFLCTLVTGWGTWFWDALYWSLCSIWFRPIAVSARFFLTFQVWTLLARWIVGHLAPLGGRHLRSLSEKPRCPQNRLSYSQENRHFWGFSAELICTVFRTWSLLEEGGDGLSTWNRHPLAILFAWKPCTCCPFSEGLLCFYLSQSQTEALFLPKIQ